MLPINKMIKELSTPTALTFSTSVFPAPVKKSVFLLKKLKKVPRSCMCTIGVRINKCLIKLAFSIQVLHRWFQNAAGPYSEVDRQTSPHLDHQPCLSALLLAVESCQSIRAWSLVILSSATWVASWSFAWFKSSDIRQSQQKRKWVWWPTQYRSS